MNEYPLTGPELQSLRAWLRSKAGRTARLFSGEVNDRFFGIEIHLSDPALPGVVIATKRLGTSSLDITAKARHRAASGAIRFATKELRNLSERRQ